MKIKSTGTYETRDGRKVIVHEIKYKNSDGATVTFPIKGTIYTPSKTSTRLKKDYCIWTDDGRYDAVFGDHKRDIVKEITIESH